MSALTLLHWKLPEHSTLLAIFCKRQPAILNNADGQLSSILYTKTHFPAYLRIIQDVSSITSLKKMDTVAEHQICSSTSRDVFANLVFRIKIQHEVITRNAAV